MWLCSPIVATLLVWGAHLRYTCVVCLPADWYLRSRRRGLHWMTEYRMSQVACDSIMLISFDICIPNCTILAVCVYIAAYHAHNDATAFKHLECLQSWFLPFLGSTFLFAFLFSFSYSSNNSWARVRLIKLANQLRNFPLPTCTYMNQNSTIKV